MIRIMTEIQIIDDLLIILMDLILNIYLKFKFMIELKMTVLL